MEPTVLPVQEAVQEDVGRRHGQLGPPGLTGSLTESGQAVHHGCVVRRVAQSVGSGVGLPGAQPPAVRPPESPTEEVGVGRGRFQPVLPAHSQGGLGQGRQHQAVPLGQDLVVQPGPDPGLPTGEESYSGPLNRIGALQVAPDRPVENIGPLKVAGPGDPVPLDGLIGVLPAHRTHFVQRPQVERALGPLRVGVLG